MLFANIKSQFRNSSIGRSLILVSVLTSSVLTLIFSGFQIYLEIQNGKESIHQSANDIADFYKETLPSAIWDLSITSIKQHADAIAKTRFVSRVRLSGNGFTTIESKNISNPNGPTYSFDLQFTPNSDDRKLAAYIEAPVKNSVGKMELDMSYDPLYSDIYTKLLYTLGTNFLKTVIVTCVLLFFYYRWVTLPVLKLSQKARNFKAYQKEIIEEIRPQFLRKADSHFKTPNNTINNNSRWAFLRKSKNEIETLTDYFEDMQKYFRESFFLILDSEDRFKTVALKGLDCVFETDLDLNITFFISNDKFKKQNCIQFKNQSPLNKIGFPAETNSEILKIFNTKSISTNTQMEDHLFTIKKGTDHKYYILSLRPFTSNDCTVAGYRGYLEDITEKIVANEQIGRQQDQIRQIQKLETIGELAAGIAHDFNNVLTIIDGKSTLINLYIQKPENLKVANEGIHQAVLRGRKLTGRLLQFSRKQSSDVQIISLSNQLESLKDLLTVAVSKRVELHFEYDPELWLCAMDVNMFENAVINLCVNARDAMPDGGEIFIRAKNQVIEFEQFYLSEGQYIVLEIEDSGTGMPSEILAQIFEPFFTTKGTDKGTGLGLNMVKQFVRASSGHIEVFSYVGKGTLFRMYFPRKIAIPINTANDSEQDANKKDDPFGLNKEAV